MSTESIGSGNINVNDPVDLDAVGGMPLPPGLEDQLPPGINPADVMKLIEQLVQDELEKRGVEADVPEMSETPQAAQEALDKGDIGAFIEAMVSDRLQAAGIDPSATALAGSDAGPDGTDRAIGDDEGFELTDADIMRFLEENSITEPGQMQNYLSLNDFGAQNPTGAHV